MSVKEALEGLENYITWVEDYPGELVHVDNESTEAKIHLSHVREWVALAQQAYNEGVKTIARLTAILEEARRLVDEGIAAGNHGRLDLIRDALSGRGEGSPLSENTEALRLSLLKARDGETLWHKRTVELETSMQRMIFDSPDSCREWIHKRVCETWNRLNALSGKGEGEEGELTAAEIGRRGSITWKCTKCGVTTSISRGATCEKICGCCQAPPDSPPDPVCTHCGDTKRIETECGDVVCPMCKPPPDPPCECRGSGKLETDCPACEGHGYEIRGGAFCLECDGTGKVPCPKGCKPEPVDFDTCPHCGKQTALSRECVFDLVEGDSESPPAESVCTECGKAFTIERLKCE